MAMDPITSQLTNKALKNVGKLDSMGGGAKPAYQIEKSGFGKVMDGQMNASSQATEKLLGMVDQMSGSASGNMKAIPANEIQVDLKKVGDVQGTGANNKTALFDMLKEVNGSQNNMDSLLEQLSSGKKFNTQEMVRLQVFAHSHTVTYELVTKAGDMVRSAVQTPFQMQV